MASVNFFPTILNLKHVRWIGVRDTQQSNGGFITYWLVSVRRDWMDDEMVQFLGKPDEQGELRDMDFAWEIDYHEQSK